MSEETKMLEGIGQYKYGFHDAENYVFKSQRGLSREVVENISRMKGEPQWMLDFRLKGLAHFLARPMPTWGADISGLDLDNIFYYVKPTEGSKGSWDDVPDTIKNTFDKLGIPEAERKFLAGVGAQYESEMVYHSILEHLEKQGVIFLSIEDGLRQHPDLFREYFGTVIPIEDNKFAALNSAVWSGGSFVYVPKGVKVDLPLQAYFRLNIANVGQFERSLIIVDEGAQVHYVEGCTAPQYTTNSFHSRRDRNHREERGALALQHHPELVHQCLQPGDPTGQGVCKCHPGMGGCQPRLQGHDEISILLPDGTGCTWRNAFDGFCRSRPAPGCRIEDDPFCSKYDQQDHFQVHLEGRRTLLLPWFAQSYKGATGVRSNATCDALILDPQSRSDTYPYIEIDER